jgi:hypothetical protein
LHKRAPIKYRAPNKATRKSGAALAPPTPAAPAAQQVGAGGIISKQETGKMMMSQHAQIKVLASHDASQSSNNITHDTQSKIITLPPTLPSLLLQQLSWKVLMHFTCCLGDMMEAHEVQEAHVCWHTSLLDLMTLDPQQHIPEVFCPLSDRTLPHTVAV